MVDIDIVLDESYLDPKVTIHTRERTEQIENIIDAIENASERGFPMIPVNLDGTTELIAQRDIFRVYTNGRKILLESEFKTYTVGKSLSGMEEVLNCDRFVRISQSEIINLYKVKCFEFSTAGTIGIEFENGTHTWASRSRVKAIKELLKQYRQA